MLAGRGEIKPISSLFDFLQEDDGRAGQGQRKRSKKKKIQSGYELMKDAFCQSFFHANACKNLTNLEITNNYQVTANIMLLRIPFLFLLRHVFA